MGMAAFLFDEAESFNSFGAKFQMTFVVCFFFYFNKLLFGKVFICKMKKKMNVKNSVDPDKTTH